MSEEQVVGESEEVVVQVDDKTVEPNEEEQKALRMGWTPKEQFKGDPDKWRSAAEFLERGETMLPIVRATVKRQEREIAELKASMKQFAEFHSKTEKRAYENAMADLKAQRAEAIAAGDGVAFAKVDDAIDDLKKDIDKSAKQERKETYDDPVYDEWVSRNKWMAKQDLAEEAEALAHYLRAHPKHKSLTGGDFLELLTKEMKAKFPAEFENPRRTSASTVESGGATQRKGGKSYADMPADVRNECDKMVRQYGIKKDEYVKTYFDEA